VVVVPEEEDGFLADLPEQFGVVVGFAHHLFDQGVADFSLADLGEHVAALLQQNELALHTGLDHRDGLVLQVGLEYGEEFDALLLTQALLIGQLDLELLHGFLALVPVAGLDLLHDCLVDLLGHSVVLTHLKIHGVFLFSILAFLLHDGGHVLDFVLGFVLVFDGVLEHLHDEAGLGLVVFIVELGLELVECVFVRNLEGHGLEEGKHSGHVRLVVLE